MNTHLPRGSLPGRLHAVPHARRSAAAHRPHSTALKSSAGDGAPTSASAGPATPPSGPSTSTSAGPATPPSGPSAADPAPTADLGVGLKAAWYTAEAVGNAVGAAKAVTGSARATSPASSSPPAAGRLAWADAVAAIKADYDVVYFVSGKGDLAAYDPDCYFADPFAGFKGTARFVNNVSNLGSTLSDVKLTVTSFEEDEAARTVRTAWKFSGVVNALPWRPRLAAAGSTTHTLDAETGRVVKHVEAWASSPAQVLAALVKPSAEVPGNRWERGAAALYEGDVRGLAAAGLSVFALAAFHAAGYQTAVRLVTGGGGGWGEGFLWGAGVVLSALDTILPMFGTGGSGRPVRRK